MKKHFLLFYLCQFLGSALLLRPALADNKCLASYWHKGWQGYERASSLRERYSCKTFIYFTMDHCAPCKILQQNIFSKEGFYLGLQNVTKIKIKLPGDWKERRLVKALNVKGAPAFFVIESGQEGQLEAVQIALHRTNMDKGRIDVVTVQEAISLIQGK